MRCRSAPLPPPLPLCTLFESHYTPMHNYAKYIIMYNSPAFAPDCPPCTVHSPNATIDSHA